MKISAKSRNLGWKERKFQRNRRSVWSRKCETDSSRVRMSSLMRHEFLMSLRQGTRRLKKPRLICAQMRLQLDQVWSPLVHECAYSTLNVKPGNCENKSHSLLSNWKLIFNESCVQYCNLICKNKGSKKFCEWIFKKWITTTAKMSLHMTKPTKWQVRPAKT